MSVVTWWLRHASLCAGPDDTARWVYFQSEGGHAGLPFTEAEYEARCVAGTWSESEIRSGHAVGGSATHTPEHAGPSSAPRDTIHTTAGAFVVDTVNCLISSDSKSGAQAVFFADCVRAVDAHVRAEGGVGVDVCAAALSEIPAVLAQYCVRFGVTEVRTNRGDDPWTASLDAVVHAALAAAGVTYTLTNHHALAPRTSDAANKATRATPREALNERSFEAYSRTLRVDVVAGVQPFPRVAALPSATLYGVPEASRHSHTVISDLCDHLLSTTQAWMAEHAASSGDEVSEASAESLLKSPQARLILSAALTTLRACGLIGAEAVTDAHTRSSTYTHMYAAQPVIQALVTCGYLRATDVWHVVSHLVRVISQQLHTLESTPTPMVAARGGVSSRTSLPMSGMEVSDGSTIDGSARVHGGGGGTVSTRTGTGTGGGGGESASQATNMSFMPGEAPLSGGVAAATPFNILGSVSAAAAMFIPSSLWIALGYPAQAPGTGIGTGTGGDEEYYDAFDELACELPPSYAASRHAHKPSQPPHDATRATASASVLTPALTSERECYARGAGVGDMEAATSTHAFSAGGEVTHSNDGSAGALMGRAQLSSLRSISFMEACGSTSTSQHATATAHKQPNSTQVRFLKQTLHALLEYFLRLLRWLTMREYAATVLLQCPELAAHPARPELSPLPWCALGPLPTYSHSQAKIVFSTAHTVAPDVAKLTHALSKVYHPTSTHHSHHTPVPEHDFISGRTGFPLVDATVCALRERGHAPLPLYALIQNLWCKSLGQPWHRGMHLLSHWMLDFDVGLAVLQWQWNTGLVGGCGWAVPTDYPDLLHGYVSPTMLQHIRPEGYDVSLLASRYPWDSWPRYSSYLPPHPHCMGYPAGEEYAFACDPYGLFVRTVLGGGNTTTTAAASSVAVSPLSPRLPDAYVYEPWLATSDVLTACGQGIDREKAAAPPATWRKDTHWYPPPSLSLALSRQRCMECVQAVAALANSKAKHTSASASASASASSGGSSTTPVAVSRALLAAYMSATAGGTGDRGGGKAFESATYLIGADPILRFLQGRCEAGYDALWGSVGSHPILVEEDVFVLQNQQSARKEDGWAEIVKDADIGLNVFLQSRSDSAVKTLLATSNMARYSATEVFDAIDSLRKYVTWDRTWIKVSALGESLDPFNVPYHFVADAPPPPYSYLITSRDFVMFRHSFRHPFLGFGVNVLRNGSHAAMPPRSTFIRGETLGCAGFVVRPLAAPPTAASVCGTIPSCIMTGAGVAGTGAGLGTDARGGASSSGTATGSTPVLGSSVMVITAADPKGSIPAYLINFMVKRTPRMWIQRLNDACDRFRAEEEG